MPLPHRSGRVLVTALAAVLLGGCVPDAFTYANDAKAEGKRLYDAGDYLNAAAAYANAAGQAPRDYQALFYEGASYQAAQAYQQAIAAYRAEQAVRPLTLAGQQDTGIGYRTMDNLAQCIAKSETGIAEETAALDRRRGAVGPDADDYWYQAKLYRYGMDPDAAIEAYTKAVLIAPARFDIAKEAGLYEEGLGQTQQAATTLKTAYAANPDDEQVNQALRRLGVVLGPSLKDASTLSHI